MMLLDSLEGDNKAERDFESTVGTGKNLRMEDQREDITTSTATRGKEGSKA